MLWLLEPSFNALCQLAMLSAFGQTWNDTEAIGRLGSNSARVIVLHFASAGLGGCNMRSNTVNVCVRWWRHLMKLVSQ